MINQLIYSPFLKENIPVKAENQTELERYIEACEQLRDESTGDIWHVWEAILQAHLEALDICKKGRWSKA